MHDQLLYYRAHVTVREAEQLLSLWITLLNALSVFLSPVHASNNIEATVSIATSRTILSFEHVQFVSTLSKGRNFTKNAFDIVAKTAAMSKQRSTYSKQNSTL